VRFFIYVLVLALVGCKTPDAKVIPSYLRINSAQARTIITNICGAEVVLTDEEYAVPTEEWVTRAFTPTFKKFLFGYDVRRYSADRNKCDKFSLYARTVANVLNRHNLVSSGAGIAFGEVYLSEGFYGHAMNFVIVAGEDKRPKLLFYEPQIQQLMTVSTNNLAVLEWRM
jgi:hypothetical protein